MLAGEFTKSLTRYHRRPTIVVHVGNIPMGGDYPVRLQSMTNTHTCNIGASIEQCVRLRDAGAEYVRFTVPSAADVVCLKRIRQALADRKCDVPLIADVHFNPAIALEAVTAADKVRINPGNYGGKQAHSGHLSPEVYRQFKRLLEACRKKRIALRIGVNHGSLSPRMVEKYGDSPEGMAESAMELLRICKEEHFDQVVVSMKSSNVRVMVYATRLVVHRMNEEDMHHPVHLGVTEAGEGEDGRIRSAAGIGALLSDGIGDTIRVSLTEDPVSEIPVARKLVLHFSDIRNHASLPEADTFFAGSFAYRRRDNRPSAFVGGSNVPVVIAGPGPVRRKEEVDWASFGWKYDKNENAWQFDDMSADFIFMSNIEKSWKLPATKAIILPFVQWKEHPYENTYPLLNVQDDFNVMQLKGMLHFISARMEDLTDTNIDRLREDDSAVMVFESSNKNVTAELRAVFGRLHQRRCQVPVVVRRTYSGIDAESFRIKSAADLGGPLIDGLVDGIWLAGPGQTSAGPEAEQPGTGRQTENNSREVVTTAFRILQACRLRISQTEYISCPSCGRTHFDLMSTVAKIREKTGHLKGLKIAIMGCIVNGPGEMADADYGYVGSGMGKVTLYKAHEVIRRGIPENRAVGELVDLIKESGDWKDPQ